MIFAEFLYKVDGFPIDKLAFAPVHWKLNKPWATPCDTFTCAHDLVEHSPDDDDGSLEAEFMALGSGLLLRTDIADGVNDAAALIAGDIGYIIRTYSNNNVKPVNPLDITDMPPEYCERVGLLRRIVLQDYKGGKMPNFSEDTINNALAWAHAGTCRAYHKHRGRINDVAAFFKRLRNAFKTWGYSIMEDGRLLICFDWDGTVDMEFIPEKIA